MKKTALLLCLAAAFTLSGCHIFKAVNMAYCNYEYSSFDNLRFLNKSPRELLTISGAATVTAALLGKSETAPLDMTVHVQIINPDEKKTAELKELYYQVQLDSVYVGEGRSLQSITIGPKDTVDLPLQLGVDLKKVIKGEQKSVVTKAVKGMIGMTSEPTRVTLLLQPTIQIGKNGAYTYPKFIPVSFNIGGKK